MPTVAICAVFQSTAFSMARESAVGFRISFTGNPARTCAIQFTPGLSPANWHPLGTATADAQSGYLFIDVPPAGTVRRFYRSVVP